MSSTRCPPKGALAKELLKEMKLNRKQDFCKRSTAPPKRRVFYPVEALSPSPGKAKVRNHLLSASDEVLLRPLSLHESQLRDKLLAHAEYLSRSPTRGGVAKAPRSPNPRRSAPMPFLRTSAELADISRQIVTTCDSPKNAKLTSSSSKQKRPSSSSSSSFSSPKRSIANASASSLSPQRGDSVSRSVNGKGGSPTRMASRKDLPFTFLEQSMSVHSSHDFDSAAEIAVAKSDGDMMAPQ